MEKFIQKIKSFVNKTKKSINNKIYAYVFKTYVQMTNNRQKAFKVMKDGYDYYILSEFQGFHFSIVNPVEYVYFSLRSVFGDYYSNLQISGISVDYFKQNPDYITVTIKTRRPGLIIGKNGRDIDQLSLYLSNYFGKLVKIDLKEDKTRVSQTVL